jgi:hypothetical protein
MRWWLPGSARVAGKQARVRKLCRELEQDWLLIADWNFYTWDGWLVYGRRHNQ